ncbi:hypothetical protein [Roseovarius litorisediminis]|uniref:hypothetical protein n=1 Tax=Roseovarius litorisediminis TaxID=1312363 RepID=UPI00159476CB|nr:hypothetical protein [Roseovarius litorisediminis]
MRLATGIAGFSPALANLRKAALPPALGREDDIAYMPVRSDDRSTVAYLLN